MSFRNDFCNEGSSISVCTDNKYKCGTLFTVFNSFLHFNICKEILKPKFYFPTPSNVFVMPFAFFKSE